MSSADVCFSTAAEAGALPLGQDVQHGARFGTTLLHDNKHAAGPKPAGTRHAVSAGNRCGGTFAAGGVLLLLCIYSAYCLHYCQHGACVNYCLRASVDDCTLDVTNRRAALHCWT